MQLDANVHIVNYNQISSCYESEIYMSDQESDDSIYMSDFNNDSMSTEKEFTLEHNTGGTIDQITNTDVKVCKTECKTPGVLNHLRYKVEGISLNDILNNICEESFSSDHDISVNNDNKKTKLGE